MYAGMSLVAYEVHSGCLAVCFDSFLDFLLTVVMLPAGTFCGGYVRADSDSLEMHTETS